MDTYKRFVPANVTTTTSTMNDDTDHCFDPANDLPNHMKTKHQTQTDKKAASSQRMLANQGDCQTTKGAKSEAEQSHQTQKQGGTITSNMPSKGCARYCISNHPRGCWSAGIHTMQELAAETFAAKTFRRDEQNTQHNIVR